MSLPKGPIVSMICVLSVLGVRAQASPFTAVLDPGHVPQMLIFSSDEPDRYASIGYEFTPTHDVWLTALGCFDLGSDGLNTSHQVSVWTADGGLRKILSVNSLGCPRRVSRSCLGSW